MKNQLKIGVLMIMMIFSVSSAHAQFNKRVKGNGNLVTINRNISRFDRINISGSFDVILVEGKEGLVEITAESNLTPYIETISNGDVLKIKWKSNTSISTRKNVVVKINVQKISGIKSTGSSDVIARMVLKNTSFDLSVSGSGDMKLELQAKKVKASVTGSGDMDISGNTESFSATVSGSGDIDAKGLQSKKANLKVSGSGGIRLNVSDELIARVSGSGDVLYKGSPRIEDIRVSGSGEVSTY